MKRIEGEITVGSPGSLIRYTEAKQMCVECLKLCPLPIVDGSTIRKIFKLQPDFQQCYVCEERRPSYRLE